MVWSSLIAGAPLGAQGGPAHRGRGADQGEERGGAVACGWSVRPRDRRAAWCRPAREGGWATDTELVRRGSLRWDRTRGGAIDKERVLATTVAVGAHSGLQPHDRCTRA